MTNALEVLQREKFFTKKCKSEVPVGHDLARWSYHYLLFNVISFSFINSKNFFHLPGMRLVYGLDHHCLMLLIFNGPSSLIRCHKQSSQINLKSPVFTQIPTFSIVYKTLIYAPILCLLGLPIRLPFQSP